MMDRRRENVNEISLPPDFGPKAPQGAGSPGGRFALTSRRLIAPAVPVLRRILLEADKGLGGRGERQRRSVSQVVVLLLEKALEADGLWPPAEKDDA
jgi:hypothetical protein